MFHVQSVQYYNITDPIVVDAEFGNRPELSTIIPIVINFTFKFLAAVVSRRL